MDRAAADGELHLSYFGGPGVVVEIGAHFDDVVADEFHRLVVILEPVVLAHLLPHDGHGVKVIGDEVRLLVIDCLEHPLASGYQERLPLHRPKGQAAHDVAPSRQRQQGRRRYGQQKSRGHKAVSR